MTFSLPDEPADEPAADSAPAASPSGAVAIIVGGDALAFAVCAELHQRGDGNVALIWHSRTGPTEAAVRLGARFTQATPDTAEGLVRAGILGASTIVALSDDDRLNLHVALRARDLNPSIRIVLRQFNRTLGRKIEQNLPDCSVLSLASHSAATYAAALVDSNCFHGLQFPDIDGPLTGFSRRMAGACELAGLSREEAEQCLGTKILAVDGDFGFDAEAALPEGAELLVFAPLHVLERSLPEPPAPPAAKGARQRLRTLFAQMSRWRSRFDPLLLRVVTLALGIFIVATWYFKVTLGSDLLTAAYFVVTTMSTTGYGDMAPDRSKPISMIVAMVVMLFGIGFFGIFTASATALLSRAQQVRIQGLRHIRGHGHLVICGAGNIGMAVIEYLLDMKKKLVVIEHHPDRILIEWAVEHRIDLLTGDATRDATLDFCNLANAHGLMALSNSDTTNLEAALGARARNPALPLVLRIADAEFAASIARHFQFETTFSAAALVAPAFVGLVRHPDARGRLCYGGRDYAILEHPVGAGPLALLPGMIPLAFWREGAFILAAGGAEPLQGDRMLFLQPCVF